MECTTHRPNIVATFERVRTHSFEEKKSPVYDEERINAFLDSINSFKKTLDQRSAVIFEINDLIEELTWFSDLDNDCLMLISDLIAVTKDWQSTLIRQYASMARLRKDGIAKTEIKNFKASVDELKESYEDLESIFFALPKMPEFKETTKALSLL